MADEHLIRVGVHPQDPSLFALRRKGFLTRRLIPLGAAVQWVACRDGAETLERLAAGAIDVGGSEAATPPLAGNGDAELVRLAAAPTGPVAASASASAPASAPAASADRLAWFGRRTFAERDPQLVEAFLAALVEIDAWIADQPAIAAELFAAHAPGVRSRADWEAALRRRPWGPTPLLGSSAAA